MNIKIHNQTKIKINFLKKKLFKVFNYIKDSKKMHIIFIKNNKMKKMNYYYRKKKYSTDILTFINEIKDDSLGDIFISLVKASQQAKKYNNSLIKEVCFLTLHGYLHLKGYTDNTEDNLKKMVKVQKQVLNRFFVNKNKEVKYIV
ncbi:putative rRNA maturation factor YbeY [Candidatus Phytoplasma oryzae]|uniref:Endoribonuclease YbeY n=1 Tax=Candidatus Phytoplasma oryzae TaxID=203274 RepID=A0A139JR55_9MOLU|nr:rRNA maturation RNase YbeY [Candidatus Phytoplasma oryzae]KXT29330.1 putative rRNA maturation factor YbeY [Candidatus Phytoplasma oryzae]RAM57884.1 rRNA maturation factor [Candidatus Phytoplasma oryzae]